MWIGRIGWEGEWKQGYDRIGVHTMGLFGYVPNPFYLPIQIA